LVSRTPTVILDPSIFAQQEREFTADDAYKYFVDRAAQIAFSVNRQPVQWVEVFEVWYIDH
jgi:hypothetical protein